eukprot:CAMPEP_0204278348 /NCGR_PEP_ID=MMETSP0468-20130131/29816_1 /ASSEMBLY_ACC=CAM_ASM_000383 /TAXON_ID=2969 /ORGANISM="Oxyrrhis marina" /LENGTH=38 /DNA_ID= /DNA_START= /DNA_END= /DNA_ORIENTATION=
MCCIITRSCAAMIEAPPQKNLMGIAVTLGQQPDGDALS